MTKKQFKKLLVWRCKSFIFPFNGKFYKLIDSVAMGLPLAPALADVCMNWAVDEAIKKSNSSFTIFRYVDDLFLAFDNIEDLPKVSSLFNSVHNKIKFTQELEVENQLSFLDIHTTKTNCNIETRICGKPTNTGLCTSGTAIHLCVKNKT